MEWIEVVGIIAAVVSATFTFVAAVIAKKALTQWTRERKAVAKTDFLAALLDYRAEIILQQEVRLFDNSPKTIEFRRTLEIAKIKCEKYWLLSEYSKEAEYKDNASPDDNGRRLYKYYDNFKVNHDRYVTNNFSRDDMVVFCENFYSKLPSPYSEK